MNEEKVLVVAVKYAPQKVIKAKPFREGDLQEPCVSKSYFCCGLITSAVDSFSPLENGWLVKTMNSTYKFLRCTVEEVEELVKELGLVGPLQYNPPSLSFYWKEKEQTN